MKLGVISYGDYSVEVNSSYVNRHKWIVPVNVSGPVSFLLFAVWALPMGKRRFYVQPLMEAFETYKDLMHSKDVIWAGDFNANDVLDRSTPSKKYKWLNFVDSLEKEGIKSVYHQHHGCISGSERHPTHYHQHNMNKPFHIDYVLASEGFKCMNVEVGPPEKWIEYSDHMPLICDFADR